MWFFFCFEKKITKTILTKQTLKHCSIYNDEYHNQIVLLKYEWPFFQISHIQIGTFCEKNPN